MQKLHNFSIDRNYGLSKLSLSERIITLAKKLEKRTFFERVCHFVFRSFTNFLKTCTKTWKREWIFYSLTLNIESPIRREGVHLNLNSATTVVVNFILTQISFHAFGREGGSAAAGHAMDQGSGQAVQMWNIEPLSHRVESCGQKLVALGIRLFQLDQLTQVYTSGSTSGRTDSIQRVANS